MKLLELYSMGVPIFMPAPGFEVDLEEASVNLGMFWGLGNHGKSKKVEKYPWSLGFVFLKNQLCPSHRVAQACSIRFLAGCIAGWTDHFRSQWVVLCGCRQSDTLFIHALLLQMSRIIFVASLDFFLGSKLLTPRMGWMNVFYDVYVFHVFLWSILGFDMVWYTKLAGHVCFLPSKQDISSQGRFLHVVLQLDHRGPGGHGVLPIPQWCSSTVLCHAGTTTPTS